MAEYVEVIKQKKRMCNSTLCCKCDIFHLSGENIENCPQFISNNPSKAEKIIMSWAAEHPEPVYPTWYEWLTSIGAVTRKVKPDVASNLIETGLLDPIPANIAEKLGIISKESN